MREDTFPGLHSEKIVVTDSERLQAIHIASCRAKQHGDLTTSRSTDGPGRLRLYAAFLL